MGAFLLVISVLMLLDQGNEVPPLVVVLLIVGPVMITLGIRAMLRERRYFDPRNEYWMEIGTEDFALVTPDATERRPWTSLTPFEVKTVERRGKRGNVVSTAYETVARYDGVEISVPLADFATQLHHERRNRAERMCMILNDLRAKALTPLSVGADYDIPLGLVVAPMPPRKRTPLVASTSVVQRE